MDERLRKLFGLIPRQHRAAGAEGEELIQPPEQVHPPPEQVHPPPPEQVHPPPEPGPRKHISEISDAHKKLLASQNIHIHEKLDEGIYGVVYRACGDFQEKQSDDTYQTKHKQCAVKYLRYGGIVTNDIIDNELATLQEIRHDNVVSLLSTIILCDESIAIFLELAEYGSFYTFADLILKGELKKMTEEQVEKLAFGLCSAIEAVHQARRSHSDLHSGNILMFGDEEGGFVGKLADFGAVRVFGEEEEEEDIMQDEQEGDRWMMMFILEGIVNNDEIVEVSGEWREKMLGQLSERLRQG